MLFTARHEPLTENRSSEAAAREAIARIGARAGDERLPVTDRLLH